MTQQISIAIAGQVNGNQAPMGRPDPRQMAMQQLTQFMTGLVAGRMMAQMLSSGAGAGQGCPCSQFQSPNFGMGAPGMNGNFMATPFPSLATGGFGPNLNASSGLTSGLPSLAFSGGAAMQAAQMQMIAADQQQAMTIGTVGGGFPSGYMGLPGSFANGINTFLG